MASLLVAAVFLLLAPLHGFGLSPYPINDQRSAQVLVIVLTQAALLHRIVTRQHLPSLPVPAWICLAGFISLGLLSSVISSGLEAYGEVALWIGLGSLALGTAQVVKSHQEDALTWIGNAALCLAGVYVLGVAARLTASLQLGQEIDVYVFLLSGYTNPRFPSTTMALLSVLVLLRTNRDLRSAIVPIAFASLVWSIQLGLGTRAAWVATGLAIIALTLLVGIRRSAKLQILTLLSMGLGTLVFFTLIAAGSLWNSGLGMLGRMNDLAAPNLRDFLWRRCLEFIADSPLLGIGPMQFAADARNQFAHPHNWLLQLAAEWGLPATLLLCAAVVFLWRTWSAEKPEGISEERRDVLLLAVLVALIYGLLDGNYVMPISQTAVALTFGAFVGSCAIRRPEPATLKGAVPLVGVLLYSAITLTVMTAVTVPCQSAAVEQSIRKLGFGSLAPRFWLDGWIPFCR